MASSAYDTHDDGDRDHGGDDKMSRDDWREIEKSLSPEYTKVIKDLFEIGKSLGRQTSASKQNSLDAPCVIGDLFSQMELPEIVKKNIKFDKVEEQKSNKVKNQKSNVRDEIRQNNIMSTIKKTFADFFENKKIEKIMSGDYNQIYQYVHHLFISVYLEIRAIGIIIFCDYLSRSKKVDATMYINSLKIIQTIDDFIEKWENYEIFDIIEKSKDDKKSNYSKNKNTKPNSKKIYIGVIDGLRACKDKVIKKLESLEKPICSKTDTYFNIELQDIKPFSEAIYGKVHGQIKLNPNQEKICRYVLKFLENNNEHFFLRDNSMIGTGKTTTVIALAGMLRELKEVNKNLRNVKIVYVTNSRFLQNHVGQLLFCAGVKMGVVVENNYRKKVTTPYRINLQYLCDNDEENAEVYVAGSRAISLENEFRTDFISTYPEYIYVFDEPSAGASHINSPQIFANCCVMASLPPKIIMSSATNPRVDQIKELYDAYKERYPEIEIVDVNNSHIAISCAILGYDSTYYLPHQFCKTPDDLITCIKSIQLNAFLCRPYTTFVFKNLYERMKNCNINVPDHTNFLNSRNVTGTAIWEKCKELLEILIKYPEHIQNICSERIVDPACSDFLNFKWDFNNIGTNMAHKFPSNTLIVCKNPDDFAKTSFNSLLEKILEETKIKKIARELSRFTNTNPHDSFVREIIRLNQEHNFDKIILELASLLFKDIDGNMNFKLKMQECFKKQQSSKISCSEEYKSSNPLHDEHVDEHIDERIMSIENLATTYINDLINAAEILQNKHEKLLKSQQRNTESKDDKLEKSNTVIDTNLEFHPAFQINTHAHYKLFGKNKNELSSHRPPQCISILSSFCNADVRKYIDSTTLLLLWAGVGIYNPKKDKLNAYDELVMSMASKKELAFLIGSFELAYGINIPIPCVVVTSDSHDQTVNTIMQLMGRTGRMGMSSKGYCYVAQNIIDNITRYLNDPLAENIEAINMMTIFKQIRKKIEDNDTKYLQETYDRSLALLQQSQTTEIIEKPKKQMNIVSISSVEGVKKDVKSDDWSKEDVLIEQNSKKESSQDHKKESSQDHKKDKYFNKNEPSQDFRKESSQDSNKESFQDFRKDKYSNKNEQIQDQKKPFNNSYQKKTSYKLENKSKADSDDNWRK